MTKPHRRRSLHAMTASLCLMIGTGCDDGEAPPADAGDVSTAAPAASEAPSDAEPPTASELAAGDGAPDFTLTDANGERLQLSDYRGQTVVLAFSRAHW